MPHSFSRPSQLIHEFLSMASVEKTINMRLRPPQASSRGGQAVGIQRGANRSQAQAPAPQPDHLSRTGHGRPRRETVRDPETPTGRRGRRYVLRSRIRCRACQRRMCGTWRASSSGTV